jgi:hypothetical protein
MEAINAARGSPRFLQINLTAAVLVGYSELSRKKKRPGLATRMCTADNRPPGGFFSSVPPLHLLWTAVVGIPSGMPVSVCAGSPTLPFAVLPFGDGGSYSMHTEAIMPSTTTTPNSSAASEPIAHHQAFSWLHTSRPNDRGAALAATTLDVCQGIALCVEIVHSSDLTRLHNNDADPGEEAVPTLGAYDTDRLLRLAKSAAELMAAYAEDHIEWLNNVARNEQSGGANGSAA